MHTKESNVIIYSAHRRFFIGKEINHGETSCLHFCFTERMYNIFLHSVTEAELLGTSTGFVEERGGRE